MFEPSTILLMKPIDMNKNQLITYDNYDGNTSFKYKINQIENINRINIRITNQDNQETTSLGDWQLTFQFEQHYENVTEKILSQIKEYISYIFLLIGNYLS